ncbi:MAG: serine/threonine-protein phosphatase [Lachnospiraceae bacterium]|nr:serine/threonine-protein phosphatase [Lachnospiraceae bacterium]
MNWTIDFVSLTTQGTKNTITEEEETVLTTEESTTTGEDTATAEDDTVTAVQETATAGEETAAGGGDTVAAGEITITAVEDAAGAAELAEETDDAAQTLVPDETWNWRTPVTLPAWGMSLLVLTLTLMTAAVITLVVQRVFRQRKTAAQNAGEDSKVTGITPAVGKLHSQGARSAQQDSFSVSPLDLYASHGLLAVVADGMGGLEDGDQVSQTAVTAMMDGFYSRQDPDPALTLLHLLYDANGAVNRFLGLERIGMCGSTVAAGLLKDGKFYFISVGDSRISHYRDGRLTQLNRGHSYARDLELRAINGEGVLEEARTHPQAAGLTSFLGMGQLRYVDQPDAPMEVCPGDRFLLMSDGVYNALKEEEICRALDLEDVQQAADALARAIEEKSWPGQDNYTAVILGC